MFYPVRQGIKVQNLLCQWGLIAAGLSTFSLAGIALLIGAGRGYGCARCPADLAPPPEMLLITDRLPHLPVFAGFSSSLKSPCRSKGSRNGDDLIISIHDAICLHIAEEEKVVLEKRDRPGFPQKGSAGTREALRPASRSTGCVLKASLRRYSHSDPMYCLLDPDLILALITPPEECPKLRARTARLNLHFR